MPLVAVVATLMCVCAVVGLVTTMLQRPTGSISQLDDSVVDGTDLDLDAYEFFTDATPDRAREVGAGAWAVMACCLAYVGYFQTALGVQVLAYLAAVIILLFARHLWGRAHEVRTGIRPRTHPMGVMAESQNSQRF